VRLQDVHKSFRRFAEEMNEKEVLRILRRLDEIERENPELYRKVMFESLARAHVEQKERRCSCNG